MITPSMIHRKTMTEEKCKSAVNDYFAFYVGRPISYLLTIPFLYTSIKPNTISILSIFPLIAAFIVFCAADNIQMLLIGWSCLFLWNLLDGVDGNVARYKQEFSKLGSVYDAMSGYIAMVITFFAVGIAAGNMTSGQSIYPFVSKDYIILGALSGIFVIFPRLIMHKIISTVDESSNVKDVKDKSGYGIVQIIALNFSSVTGGAQVFLFVAIILNVLDIYTVIYFIFNFIVMIVSLRKMLRE